MGVVLGKYVAIKIPQELTDEMDKLIGKFGFRTRAEITKEAIRRLIIDLNFGITQDQPLEAHQLERS